MQSIWPPRGTCCEWAPRLPDISFGAFNYPTSNRQRTSRDSQTTRNLALLVIRTATMPARRPKARFGALAELVPERATGAGADIKFMIKMCIAAMLLGAGLPSLGVFIGLMLYPQLDSYLAAQLAQRSITAVSSETATFFIGTLYALLPWVCAFTVLVQRIDRSWTYYRIRPANRSPVTEWDAGALELNVASPADDLDREAEEENAYLDSLDMSSTLGVPPQVLTMNIGGFWLGIFIHILLFFTVWTGIMLYSLLERHIPRHLALVAAIWACTSVPAASLLLVGKSSAVKARFRPWFTGPTAAVPYPTRETHPIVPKRMFLQSAILGLAWISLLLASFLYIRIHVFVVAHAGALMPQVLVILLLLAVETLMIIFWLVGESRTLLKAWFAFASTSLIVMALLYFEIVASNFLACFLSRHAIAVTPSIIPSTLVWWFTWTVAFASFLGVSAAVSVWSLSFLHHRLSTLTAWQSLGDHIRPVLKAAESMATVVSVAVITLIACVLFSIYIKWEVCTLCDTLEPFLWEPLPHLISFSSGLGSMAVVWIAALLLERRNRKGDDRAKDEGLGHPKLPEPTDLKVSCTKIWRAYGYRALCVVGGAGMMMGFLFCQMTCPCWQSPDQPI